MDSSHISRNHEPSRWAHTRHVLLANPIQKPVFRNKLRSNCHIAPMSLRSWIFHYANQKFYGAAMYAFSTTSASWPALLMSTWFSKHMCLEANTPSKSLRIKVANTHREPGPKRKSQVSCCWYSCSVSASGLGDGTRAMSRARFKRLRTHPTCTLILRSSST